MTNNKGDIGHYRYEETHLTLKEGSKVKSETTALEICHDTVHQKVAKQLICQNYCNSNSYEEKYHLLILVMVKNSHPRQARTPARRYS